MQIKKIEYINQFKPTNCSNSLDLFEYWGKYIQIDNELEAKLKFQNIYDCISDTEILANVFTPLFPLLNRTKNLNVICNNVIDSLINKSDFFQDIEINFVLYFGNGIGAGWYTIYDNKPSILLGFENILILNWDSKQQIESLIFHEIGHIIHDYYRNNVIESNSNNIFYKLYREGFAHFICSQIQKHDNFSEFIGNEEEFKDWFNNEYKIICFDFLNNIENKDFDKKVFGSWNNYNGYKQVGYYLGFKIMQELVKIHTIQEISNFSKEEIDKYIGNILTTAST